MGNFYNVADRCAPQARIALRYEVLDEQGAKLASVDLNPGVEKSGELPAGTHSVRIFRYESSEWKYWSTLKSLNVTEDKWTFAIGCKHAGSMTLSRIR